MVCVVGDSHRHSARGGVAQGAGHDVAGLTRQPHVVQGEVERALCLAEKGGHPLSHLEVGLATRMQRGDLEH